METGAVGIGLVVTLTALVQSAWYLVVLWLLVKIWWKVRHLPD